MLGRTLENVSPTLALPPSPQLSFLFFLSLIGWRIALALALSLCRQLDCWGYPELHPNAAAPTFDMHLANANMENSVAAVSSTVAPTVDMHLANWPIRRWRPAMLGSMSSKSGRQHKL